ncbi:MAG: ribosomal RNA small subunit methyltransferase I [Candidatus Hodgkinia cicadicola]
MATVNIISTPIGNMLDITLRALILLKTGFVLCENPEVTRKVLAHYGVKNKLYKLNQLNCRNIAKLKRDVCLVSDAGTPLVSDPGFKAVSVFLKHDYAVKAVPGACAVLCALVCAKAPTNKFLFTGFLSKSKHKVKAQLIKLVAANLTIIAFESPNRIKTTLETIARIAGPNFRLALCLELTKLNEKTIRGRVNCVLNHLHKLKPIGEITLVLLPQVSKLGQLLC